jgi:AraC-like DNA-binding protein
VVLTLGVRAFLHRTTGYEVRPCPSWDALIEAARREVPSTAVLVDAYADSREEPDAALHELLQVAPLLPVLVPVNLSASSPERVRPLLEWGVSELVDFPIEAPPEALVARLRAAHARPFKRRLEMLSRYASGNAMTLIRAAAEVTADGGLSTDLAKVFGVRERTLAGWCAREALPPPRRLLAWTRVLLAVGLLEEPARTWRNVARSTGYVDEGGLRRAIKSLVGGENALAERRQPASAQALVVFAAEMRDRRERLRRSRKTQRLAAGSP